MSVGSPKSTSSISEGSASLSSSIGSLSGSVGSLSGSVGSNSTGSYNSSSSEESSSGSGCSCGGYEIAYLSNILSYDFLNNASITSPCGPWSILDCSGTPEPPTGEFWEWIGELSFVYCLEELTIQLSTSGYKTTAYRIFDDGVQIADGLIAPDSSENLVLTVAADSVITVQAWTEIESPTPSPDFVSCLVEVL